MKKCLVCIDAYAQIYRSFYAVRALTNSKGEPSNAVFAMTKFLMKADDEFKDCDGAFFFDSGKCAHRVAISPSYKANRPPMPDALKFQMPLIKDLVSAFGWPDVVSEGWEADDLIGCAVKLHPGRKRLIVSADKDLSQLVCDGVEMLVPDQANKGFSVRGEKETLEKFGVPPCRIVDYLALIGDASDNIPGIDGVGPKTAAELINSCGSIDEMLASPERISREKLRVKITAGADILKRNIKLIELVTVPPENADLSDAAFIRRDADYAKILAIAEAMELKSLIKEIEKRISSSNGEKSSGAPQASGAGGLEQLELF